MFFSNNTIAKTEQNATTCVCYGITSVKYYTAATGNVANLKGLYVKLGGVYTYAVISAALYAGNIPRIIFIGQFKCSELRDAIDSQRSQGARKEIGQSIEN